MPLDRPDFDNLSSADLHELVAARVPESQRVEYKRAAYGNADADKREFLKDASAFANAHGGHLIIGIEETDGAASAVPGITGLDPDAEVLRLQNLLRDGIQPRIHNPKVRSVPMAGGAFCIVVRIPQSWTLPHRVSLGNSNRFYLRNSSGVHEASMDELRDLFGFAAGAMERMNAFRVERLKLIQAGEGVRPLVADGRLILHLLPLSGFASATHVDLPEVQRLYQSFLPLGGTYGFSPRLNFDGFINERGGEQNHGYTQVFRNGTVEATQAALVREHSGMRLVAGLKLEREFFSALPKYIAGLCAIDVPMPIVVMVTLDGVMGAHYAVRDRARYMGEYRFFDRDVLRLPDCIVSDYGSEGDYQRALQPAFDALWNAMGWEHDEFFDADGTWRGDTTP